MGAAAQRWRTALESWAIPPEILADAPQSPWGFPVRLFERAADEAVGRVTATTRAAAEALPAGGVVLDIGCGAGAASIPLLGTAGAFIGVDESPEMLEAFTGRVGAGEASDASVVTHAGRWPDVAAEVGVADVAVARNVAYNVPDLGAFAAAMTAHARARVVLELTERHPLHWMNPLWRAIHDVERPDGPNVDDAVAVLEDLGLVVSIERWTAPSLLSRLPDDETIGFLVQRLCVGPERAEEVRAAVGTVSAPQEQGAATLWWDGGA